MKIKNIFVAILAVLVISACNKESITIDVEEGYLILSIANPQTKTDLGGNDPDNGTAEESAINNLKVILTDANGIVKIVAEPTLTNGVPEKVKAELGNYYVYALINSDINVVKDENINRVITTTLASDVTSGYKNGSFLMINQRNGSEIAGVQTSITKENSTNNPAKVTIYVDRVACKIIDDTDDPNIVSLLASAGNFIDAVVVDGFGVLNVNKEFNLIQQWDKNNPDGITITEDVLSTPSYDGADMIIAKQYFHNIGEYTTLTKDNGIITGIDITAGASALFVDGPVYTTENRPTIISYGDGITANRGETTGVIYKVQAKKSGSNAETFYKYKSALYSTVDDIAQLTEFKGKNIESLEDGKLRALGIQVYKEGVMYYTYFICDPNIAHQYDNKNYYGVFRNSTYKLKINSFSSLGDDVPGGAITDPSEPGEPGNPPIDTKEAYLDVTISVNPWILNLIGIDF